MAGKKIMIVEDEVIMAMAVEQKLTDLGYEVVGTVDKGEDAVKRAKELRPNLILMDIVLKGDMDGIDAAQQIHDDLDIPIIYLTAYSDDEVLKRARITEPYGYMVKPFKTSEMKAHIEMALYKHDSEKKNSENIRRKILADYYDFVLTALPQYAEASQEELRSMLLNILEKRLKEEFKPNFDEEMTGELDEEPGVLFNYYLTWLSDLFEGFGIQNKLLFNDQGYYIEFLNCPWKEEAKKKHVFCLNCYAIANSSFKWIEFEGTVNQMTTISEGSKSCIFRFR
jgi:FOG: CheY-like receiver